MNYEKISKLLSKYSSALCILQYVISGGLVIMMYYLFFIFIFG